MSAPELIQEFEKKSKAVKEAIILDNQKLLKVCDRQMSKSFDQILNEEPNNAADRLLMADFLMNHILSACEDTEINQRIGERLLELMSTREITEQVQPDEASALEAVI